MQYFSEKTKNGNIGFSLFSQEAANDQAAHMDYMKCWNCENCWGCYACLNCKNCVNCIMCGNCIACLNSIDVHSKNNMRDIIQNKFSVSDKNKQKVLSVISNYFLKPIPASYGLSLKLPANGLIPFRYILLHVNQILDFKNASDGATNMLKEIIVSLVEEGILMEVDARTDYNYRGLTYLVSETFRSQDVAVKSKPSAIQNRGMLDFDDLPAPSFKDGDSLPEWAVKAPDVEDSNPQEVKIIPGGNLLPAD